MPFPRSLTTSVFSYRSTGRLEAAPRRAAPRGHKTLIIRTARQETTQLLTKRPPVSTHTLPKTYGPAAGSLGRRGRVVVAGGTGAGGGRCNGRQQNALTAALKEYGALRRTVYAALMWNQPLSSRAGQRAARQGSFPAIILPRVQWHQLGGAAGRPACCGLGSRLSFFGEDGASCSPGVPPGAG